MKICIISSRFYPQLVGSGTMIYNIAVSLSEKGHEVTVLVDESVKNLSADMKEPYAFNVLFVPGLEAYALGKGAMQAPMTFLYQHLHQANYDMVQVCNFMPMLLVSMMRPLIKTPVVFSFYNTPNLPKRVIGYYSVPELDTALASYILTSRSYDMLVVGSQNYFDTALSLGAPLSLTRLSFLGVASKGLGAYDSTTKDYVETYLGKNITPSDTLIMLPSRITGQKGIVDGIRALKIVKERYPNIKLLLTGMVNPFDKAYAEQVMRLSEAEGVDDAIIIPKKHIKREHMVSIYQRADVVLVPSHYEGLGLSAIEAQMLERPLVAADAPGLREVANNEVNALTFDVGDPRSMANAIVRMLSDGPLRKRLTKKAKVDVEQFSLENHVSYLEDVYKDLILTHQPDSQVLAPRVE